MTTSTPWEIVLAGPARKSLERAPSPYRERIEATLREMAANPFQGLEAPQGTGKNFSPPGRRVAHFLFSRPGRKAHRYLGD
jgi:hypothetical protein